MYQVYFARRWRTATVRGEAFEVVIPENAPLHIGLTIGGEAMARKLRNGTARVVADPEPRKICVDDPQVAEMLLNLRIDYARPA